MRATGSFLTSLESKVLHDLTTLRSFPCPPSLCFPLGFSSVHPGCTIATLLKQQSALQSPVNPESCCSGMSLLLTEDEVTGSFLKDTHLPRLPPQLSSIPLLQGQLTHADQQAQVSSGIVLQELLSPVSRSLTPTWAWCCGGNLEKEP